jgi:ribosomal protein S27AE
MKLDNGDPQGGEERSAKIHRLREEIKSMIEREYALFGKYHEFATSLESIIFDEKLRQDAALQALATTLKLGKQEIVEAFGREQEELAILEKAVGELFADMGSKITAGKQGREQGNSGRKPGDPGASAPERTASHKDCPQCGERITFVSKENRWRCYSCAYEELFEGSAVADQNQEAPESSPVPMETEWQKKCPMCGGQLNFHVQDERWFCYTCAHEESATVAVQGKNEGKRDQTNIRGASASSFAIPLAAMMADDSRKLKKGAALSSSQLAGKKKFCPVCHKKMDWHEMEKIWRCFFCDHKTRY